ncbi:hypothetical protein TWF217_012075 [Orbilia oligospora]|nr:hypothetical protein TWF217_012075 [Orbilia oligospora]
MALVCAAVLGLTSKQQRNDVGEREATCSHNLTGLLTPWRHSALITLALAKYQVIESFVYQIASQLTPQGRLSGFFRSPAGVRRNIDRLFKLTQPQNSLRRRRLQEQDQLATWTSHSHLCPSLRPSFFFLCESSCICLPLDRVDLPSSASYHYIISR